MEFRKGDAEVGCTIAKVSLYSLLLLKIPVSSGSVGKQAERKRSIFDVPHLEMDITLVSRPRRRETHRSDTGELRATLTGKGMVSRDTLKFNLDTVYVTV